MLTAHEQGLTFAVFQDDENISENQIDFETVPKLSRSYLKSSARVVMEYCKRFLRGDGMLLVL